VVQVESISKVFVERRNFPVVVAASGFGNFIGQCIQTLYLSSSTLDIKWTVNGTVIFIPSVGLISNPIRRN
jgi:hypothetical protein